MIRAVRHLTVAVWALTIVLALYMGMYASVYVQSSFLSSSSSETAPQAPSAARTDQLHDFPELSLQNKIRAATIIAVARHHKDGSSVRCVIVEILKHASGTSSPLRVGEPYPDCDRTLEPGENYGEGQVMFFVGNPARFRYSVIFRGDRLVDSGRMPLHLLRAMIKEFGSE